MWEPAKSQEWQDGFDPSLFIPVNSWFMIARKTEQMIRNLFVPLLIALAIGSYQLMWRNNVKRFHPVKLPKQQSIFIEIIQKGSRRMGMKSLPEILWTESPEAAMPWVFWCRKNLLVIPEIFATHFQSHPKQREAIIYHELAHIHNGDPWKTLLVQNFSIAFSVLGTFFISFQLANTIPEWYWLGYNMRFFVNRFVPLLISGLALVYINITIIREREIRADTTAAFYLGKKLALRKALARASILANDQPKTEPITWYQRFFFRFMPLFIVHPSLKTRNLYLYDERLTLAPRPSSIFVAGFVSILLVETALRSSGSSPLGQGWGPFISLTLDFAVGQLSLAVLLFPLYAKVFQQGRNLTRGSTFASIVGHNFVWAVGATLGGFASIPVLEPLFFKFQSPWSILISYCALTPWQIAFSLLLAVLVLKVLSVHFSRSQNNPSIFVIGFLPLLIGAVPPMIWITISTVWFNVIDSVGWRAYEVQLTLSLVLMYTGAILLILGLVIHIISQKDSESLNHQNVKTNHDQALLLSSSPYLDKLFRRRWSIAFFLFFWIASFVGVKQLHKLDVIPKWATFEAAQTPPSRDAPAGYIRFSDSMIQASVVYPQGWDVYRIFPFGIVSVEFINPQKNQVLAIDKMPTASGPAYEFLALGSYALTGEKGSKYLIEKSEPILIPTVIGEARGITMTITLPDNRIQQSAMLSLDWNYEGLDYVLRITCYPEDFQECSRIFKQFTGEFEYVSPALELEPQVQNIREFRDSKENFMFRFPLEWQLFDVANSDNVHIGSDSFIKLEDDNPEYWTQVVLEPAGPTDVFSIIMIKHSHFPQDVNISARIDAWEISQKQNLFFKAFRVHGRLSLEMGGQNALRSEFTVTYSDGEQHQGTLVLVGRHSDVWEIVCLCDLREVEQCQAALNTIVDTFEIISDSEGG
ncbi:MAG: M48 family metalloprotease [Anaerolineae bacterium]|nr:M48 family metalloprotease [Anaerolineae bacterium]